DNTAVARTVRAMRINRTPFTTVLPIATAVAPAEYRLAPPLLTLIGLTCRHGAGSTVTPRSAARDASGPGDVVSATSHPYRGSLVSRPSKLSSAPPRIRAPESTSRTGGAFRWSVTTRSQRIRPRHEQCPTRPPRDGAPIAGAPQTRPAGCRRFLHPAGWSS